MGTVFWQKEQDLFWELRHKNDWNMENARGKKIQNESGKVSEGYLQQQFSVQPALQNHKRSLKLSQGHPLSPLNWNVCSDPTPSPIAIFPTTSNGITTVTSFQ